MFNILAVNTTKRLECSVALSYCGSVWYENIQFTSHSHSEVLLPTIQSLLSKAGAKISEIGNLAAVTGPGSFTGIRIGISTLQGLSIVTGARLYGAPHYDQALDLLTFVSQQLIAGLDPGPLTPLYV